MNKVTRTQLRDLDASSTHVASVREVSRRRLRMVVGGLSPCASGTQDIYDLTDPQGPDDIYRMDYVGWRCV